MNQAIKLNPNFSNAMRDRGIASYDRHDFDRSTTGEDDAAAAKPAFAVSFAARGSAYENRREGDRIIQDAIRPIRDKALTVYAPSVAPPPPPAVPATASRARPCPSRPPRPSPTSASRRARPRPNRRPRRPPSPRPSPRLPRRPRRCPRQCLSRESRKPAPDKAGGQAPMPSRRGGTRTCGARPRDRDSVRAGEGSNFLGLLR